MEIFGSQKSSVRLMIVNHTLNSNDPFLGHQANIAVSLNQVFENVSVFTSSEPEESIPELNYFVTSVKSKCCFSRAFTLFYDFLKFLIFFRPNLVFFHMTPKHCAIFAPILKLLRIRVVLWYAHKATPISLRVSSKFADRILTPSEGSISIKNAKIMVTGHHIDSDFYFKTPKFVMGYNALFVGRLDPSKRIEVMIHALAECKSKGLELQLNLIGKPSSTEAKVYMECNYNFAISKDIKLHLSPEINKNHIRSTIWSSDLFMHASQGSLDKAPIEALIGGIPVISENREFTDIFGTWSDKFPITLSNEIEALYSLNPEDRLSALVQKQKLALEYHSLLKWTLKFRNLVEDLVHKF